MPEFYLDALLQVADASGQIDVEADPHLSQLIEVTADLMEQRETNRQADVAAMALCSHPGKDPRRRG